MRILREDFGNQSRTCTRAMITVNRFYNGKSLGCQVEQYTSLNTSLPVYVSCKYIMILVDTKYHHSTLRFVILIYSIHLFTIVYM